MNYLGSTTPIDIDNVLNHSWALADQLRIFGSVPFVASTDSVSSICGPFLNGQACTSSDIATSKGISVEGHEITSLFLNQALEYFQRGLCNLLAQYVLVDKGFVTWPSVTNYYSSFFSVHALLCLQGQTITRVFLGGRKIRCQVIALDLLNHKYSFTQRGIGSKTEHEAPWSRFYTVYDRYTYPINQFAVVHTVASITDPTEETNRRNEINYMPFRGFTEIINATDVAAFKSMYLTKLTTPPVGGAIDDYLDTLEALATDPDFRYFARSALRILFVADILRRIASSNAGLRTEWLRRLPLWQNFNISCITNLPRNYFESFPQLLQ
jgi:hypothetical protein